MCVHKICVNVKSALNCEQASSVSVFNATFFCAAIFVP